MKAFRSDFPWHGRIKGWKMQLLLPSLGRFQRSLHAQKRGFSLYEELGLPELLRKSGRVDLQSIKEGMKADGQESFFKIVMKKRAFI